MAQRLSLPHTKVLLLVIALVAFVAVAVALLGRFVPEEAPEPRQEAPATQNEADSVLKNMVYTSTDDHGVTQWELTAETATHYEAQSLIQFERLKIIFFTKGGHTYSVGAEKGTVNTETQDFTISGSVTGTSDDGILFRTDSLSYTADTREARTEDRVFLESPEFNLEGRGMVLELEREMVYLLHDVRALGKDN